MLTPFGKAIRKLRIDCSMTLKKMATDVGVSSAYLSAIETGKRQLTDEIFNSIVETLKLDIEVVKQLKVAADMSTDVVKIKSSSSSEKGKETAVMFARTFDSLSDDDFNEIMNVLEKNK
ncbi:helix-turn-helix transcriptional regulator [Shewanella sp. 202IG2-18]|uniref:helix-turn-helix domain-containing protein n=1 Tax=Parashewanella hymeniacidonis TaxID=2807618 RepID=UPI0019614C8C|nr:helix-turn-helix transcriptional regulator [Parashewanella hymeniacidonis]MBM7073487.1 helix-turn-helix transcriptional regulator [Parashewanella hymeniacidonis]